MDNGSDPTDATSPGPDEPSIPLCERKWWLCEDTM